MKNCRKFDLGSGYRLVSLRGKEGLCFTFVGNHDECDRWLDKRRAEGLHLDPAQLKPVSTDLDQVDSEAASTELLHAEAEYENYIASKLDDATIRYLFRGLRGGTFI